MLLLKVESKEMIVDYRIDDRLIHGQVCGFWIPHLSANKILIVDDEIVNDTMRKTVLKLGCPSSAGLSILSAQTAADKLIRKVDGDSRLFIICNSPKPYREMAEFGLEIPYVTIGNMSKKENTQQIRNTVFLSEENISDFKKLKSLNCKLYAQMVPDDLRIDLTEEF